MDELADVELALQCDVCGLREFYQDGGFYYCTLCNTQSQQSRLFVEDEDAGVGSQSQFRSRLAVLQDEETILASSSTSRKRLSSWELLNLVLRTLTDRLIDLGFPPLLRDAVLDLYARYLTRRKAIFVSDTHEKPSTITHREPITNIYALYGRKRLKRKNKGQKSEGKKSKESEALEETMTAAGRRRRKTIIKKKAFEQEYLGYVSDSQKTPKSTYGKKMKESNGAIPIRGAKGTSLKYTDAYSKVRKGLKNHVDIGRLKPFQSQGFISYHVQKQLRTEVFTLKSVFILLFTALRNIGCRVLLSDIIRLFSEGTLKIDNIANVLPESEVNQLNLECNEFLLCGAAAASGYKLANLAHSFESFLSYVKISNFRYPTYKEFVPKFMDDYKLPREFECLLLEFNRGITMDEIIADLQPRLSISFLNLFPEFLVMAMITVKLKMLFGMDGATEKYQSEFARVVNEITSKSRGSLGSRHLRQKEWSHLFVVEDWLSYLRYRRSIICKETMLNCCTPSLKTIHRLNNQSDSVSRAKYSVVESCNAIKSIFQGAVEDLNGGQRIPTLPTYESPNLPHEDVIKTYLNAFPTVACVGDYHKLNAEFSKNRIDFVIDPDKYICILNKAGYKVKVLNGDARNYEKLRVSKKTVLLFQPYKRYDEFIGSETEQSETIRFIFTLFASAFGGCDPEEVKQKARIVVESVGEILNRRARQNCFPLFFNRE